MSMQLNLPASQQWPIRPKDLIITNRHQNFCYLWTWVLAVPQVSGHLAFWAWALARSVYFGCRHGRQLSCPRSAVAAMWPLLASLWSDFDSKISAWCIIHPRNLWVRGSNLSGGLDRLSCPRLADTALKPYLTLPFSLVCHFVFLDCVLAIAYLNFKLKYVISLRCTFLFVYVYKANMLVALVSWMTTLPNT